MGAALLWIRRQWAANIFGAMISRRSRGSFAAGLAYGLLAGKDLAIAMEYGTAHRALAMTTRGDTSMASLAEGGEAGPWPMSAGSIVFFNGYLLHRSLPNRSPRGLRRALVNHYMSAESLLPWFLPPDGTHIGKWDYRDVVMVAGRDPYAHKGYVDASAPLIRPDRDGGCAR